MRILVCPDKFKGSLSADEVIAAVSEGIRSVYPSATILTQAMADGGEGSLDIIRTAHALTERRLEVTGPLRRPVQASYLLGEGKAYIESAKACGLHLVPGPRRNPGYTTTIGVGELIEDAIARGATDISLFLGGSSTNDAGVGMAAALGYKFFSDKGNDFVPSGDSLGYVARIDESAAHKLLQGVTVNAICDVSNQLLGPDGATFTYAGQKGATDTQLPMLESHMRSFVRRLNSLTPGSRGGKKNLVEWLSTVPGAGAAGGLGFGAVAFLGGRIVRGFDWLARTAGLPELIDACDLVITGEGKIDGQTAMGKVVDGVGGLAKVAGVPTLAVCGRNDLAAGQTIDGIDSVKALMDLPGLTEANSMTLARELIAKVVRDYLIEQPPL